MMRACAPPTSQPNTTACPATPAPSVLPQAAWLFDDARRFPPPGALYPIDLSDGSGYAPRLHIMCKGPTGTGLATFVMEAGGGAPGVEYAGVADELAAAGRRACWYDRLGYGWSDAPRALPAGNQSSAALHALLAAAGEAPPFIIAGHSAGGQLAITYAGMYPSEVRWWLGMKAGALSIGSAAHPCMQHQWCRIGSMSCTA